MLLIFRDVGEAVTSRFDFYILFPEIMLRGKTVWERKYLLDLKELIP